MKLKNFYLVTSFFMAWGLLFSIDQAKPDLHKKSEDSVGHWSQKKFGPQGTQIKHWSLRQFLTPGQKNKI
jgi:hypothetical protein